MDRVKAQEKLLQKQRLQDLLAKSPVSEKLIGNLCRYFCPSCQKGIRSLGALLNHVKTKHAQVMTEREVVLLEGNVIVAHECQQCHARVACDLKVLGGHLRSRHKIRIQEYCQYHGKDLQTGPVKASPNWKKVLKQSKKSSCVGNLCKFKCNFCLKIFSTWSQTRAHLKIHIGQKQNYETFDFRRNCLSLMVESTLFECDICKEIVLCDTEIIRGHMRRKHNLKLRQTNGEKTAFDCDKQNQVKDGVPKLANESLQKILSLCPVSEKVGNLCTFRCNVCHQKYLSVSGVKIHMKAKHNKTCSRREILENCIEQLVAHSCRLCSKLLPNETHYLWNHLVHIHQIKSIEQYCQISNCSFTTSKLRDNFQESLGDLCKFKCYMCSITKKSWRAMESHIRHKHKSGQDFKYRNYLSKSVWHHCLLCSSKLLCDRYFVQSHCRHKHKISLAEYLAKIKSNSTNDTTNPSEDRTDCAKEDSDSLKGTKPIVHQNQSAKQEKKSSRDENISLNSHSSIKECRVVLHDIMDSSDSELSDEETVDV